MNSPGDDGICLKSSFALGYPRSTENVTISDCQVSGYIEGSLLDGTFMKQEWEGRGPTGRIKFGTESNGGFKNITITNCVFDHCRGLALETVDGAILEDVTISNITMRDIMNSPIFIRLGARMRAPDSMAVGVCRRIIISNVIVYNAVDTNSASIISGIPGHEIEDLHLSNIHIYYKGEGTEKMAAGNVPEYEKDYPEPDKFKTVPAYGFFIRHVRNLDMTDISVKFLNPEKRPPFFLEDVSGARFRNIEAETTKGVPVFNLNDTRDLTFRSVAGVKDARLAKTDHSKLQ